MDVDRLVQRLRQAADAYYNSANGPIMSDEEYDRLLEKLQQIDPNHPFLHEVGAEVKFNKVRLPTKMGSLNKLEPNDIYDWLKRLPKDVSIYITPKIDGVSGMLHYKDGKLVGIYTRGNGLVGRDITQRAKGMMGIRLKPFYIEGDVFVKGEFVIHRSLFEKHFKGEYYKAPRNFCAGILNRVVTDDLTRRAIKYMTFVSFSIDTNNKNSSYYDLSKYDQLLLLRSLGFITIDYPVRRMNPTMRAKCAGDFPKAYCQRWYVFHYNKEEVSPTLLKNTIKLVRSNCDVPADGLVVEVNESKGKQLGYEPNGLNPKWARAIKLARKEQTYVVGIVDHIEWNISKRGVYKPTVILRQALSFDGVSVNRATAHNAAFVGDKGLAPGSKVKIIRSGDVIPYITAVKSSSASVEIPSRCMYCNTELEWTDSEVDIFCPNMDCEGLSYSRIKGFINALKPDSVGEGVVDQLWENGYRTLYDVLTVTAEELMDLDGFGSKRANKVVESLQNVLKDIDLANLMHATGYFATESSGLGPIRLRSIVEYLGVEAILNGKILKRWRWEIASEIEGISEIGANQFVDGLKRFKPFFRQISHLVRLNDVKPRGTKLKGLTFVFTGFRDNELEQLIINNGGKVTGTVTNATTTVFAARSGTTKERRAVALGVPVRPAYEAIDYIQTLISKQ